MVKNSDTLLEYSYLKDEINGVLYITINNQKNEDNSLMASAFDINHELVASAKSTDRNSVGYLLFEKLDQMGYERVDSEISKKLNILVDLIFKGQQKKSNES